MAVKRRSRFAAIVQIDVAAFAARRAGAKELPLGQHGDRRVAHQAQRGAADPAARCDTAVRPTLPVKFARPTLCVRGLLGHTEPILITAGRAVADICRNRRPPSQSRKQARKERFASSVRAMRRRPVTRAARLAMVFIACPGRLAMTELAPSLIPRKPGSGEDEPPGRRFPRPVLEPDVTSRCMEIGLPLGLQFGAARVGPHMQPDQPSTIKGFKRCYSSFCCRPLSLSSAQFTP